MITLKAEVTDPSDDVAKAVMVTCPGPMVATKPVGLTTAMLVSLDRQETRFVRSCVAGAPLV